MTLIDAISTIRTAIDASAVAKSDCDWETAVKNAGLTSLGDSGRSLRDEKFETTIGAITVSVHHTCTDTSRTFSPGPDRTRITLDISLNGISLDRYTNGYDT